LVTGLGSIEKIFLGPQISCFQAAARSSSYTVAFGMDMIASVAAAFLKITATIGKRRSSGIGGAI
jgi:hypothetical protein